MARHILISNPPLRPRPFAGMPGLEPEVAHSHPFRDLRAGGGNRTMNVGKSPEPVLFSRAGIPDGNRTPRRKQELLLVSAWSGKDSLEPLSTMVYNPS